MIKINELRIGNFCTVNNKTACISGLIDNLVYYVYMDDLISKNADYDLLKPLQESCEISSIMPIPITEDELVKCGFLYSGEDGYYKYFRHIETDFCVSYANNSFCCNYYDKIGDIWKNNISVKLEFIHQLQNIYHILTNEELGIIYKKE